MFSQLVAGVCVVTMLGVRCGSPAVGIVRGGEHYGRQKMQNMVKPLFDGLESIIGDMRCLCLEMCSHKQEVNKNIDSLLSLRQPIDEEKINGIVNQIYNCAAKAHLYLSFYPTRLLNSRDLRVALDKLDTCLVEARDEFSRAFGSSPAQDHALFSMAMDGSSSNPACAPIQYTAPSSLTDLDIYIDFSSLSLAGTQNSAGSVQNLQAPAGSVRSLQDLFGRAFAFISECSRKMRAELALIKRQYKPLEDYISEIQTLFNSSYVGFTGETRLGELQNSILALQNKCGSIYRAIDESLEGIADSFVNMQIERNTFNRALDHHFSYLC
ncbi:hypothetical protein PAPHI01_0125 [Pancytospora philotis]|nr:hypothetical protein PAPHI01_0125 [Pancytospora philotis]